MYRFGTADVQKVPTQEKANPRKRQESANLVSNALVPLVPVLRDAASQRTVRRSRADFIAHLIAARAQAPQTRSRRRAAPGEASAVYRALDPAPPVGQALCRSL